MGIQISRKILNLIRKKSIETDLERIDIIEFVDKHVKPAIINICMHSAYRLRHKNKKKIERFNKRPIWNFWKWKMSEIKKKHAEDVITN